jgi:hypothetical protein
VVLVLSEQFLSRPYPLEELQLLIDRHALGKAVLLPVPWDIEWADVEEMATRCRQDVAGGGDQQQLWAQLLDVLRGCAIQGEVGACDGSKSQLC